MASDEYQSCVCSVLNIKFRVNAWSGTTFGAVLQLTTTQQHQHQHPIDNLTVTSF